MLDILDKVDMEGNMLGMEGNILGMEGDILGMEENILGMEGNMKLMVDILGYDGRWCSSLVCRGEHNTVL